MALPKYALGVQRLGCQEGGCGMSTEGQISVDIRQFLTLQQTVLDGLQRHKHCAERNQRDPEPIDHGQLLAQQQAAEDCDQHDAELVDGSDL